MAEWVQLEDPSTHKTFYANLSSGACQWEAPPQEQLRERDPASEWWELFDRNHGLPYFYHPASARTVWERPSSGHVLSLVALQKLSPAAVLPEASHAQSPPLAQRSLPHQLKTDINQFMIEGFAQRFFATHKKGIFRRKVPVAELIQFTKDSLSQPLLTINKCLQKDALKCFKLIQRAMGDRTSKQRPSDDIFALIDFGINHGELRDEIYCQLVKQLTRNPRVESVRKGWEIMAALLISFPPSKNFEAYLSNVIENGTRLKEYQIDIIARHCAGKLLRICKAGPRGKTPTIVEIERAMEAAFYPSVFGESLFEIMRLQRINHPDLKLPKVLTFLVSSILALNGCQTEGIFRVPGDADQVTELRLRVEKDNYDIRGISDASVPASLLKFWLRDLAEPIIPDEFYDQCILHPEDLPAILKVLDLIPEDHRSVLYYLIHFLQIIADEKNQPVTKICPSPNLQVVLENTKYEQAFVRTLILSLDTKHTEGWR